MENSNYSTFKAAVRNGCDYFILSAGAFVAAMAIFAKQDRSQISGWPDALEPAVEWLFANTWWIVLGLTGLAAVAKVTKDRLERTWVWSAVQAIVDRIQSEAFGQQPGYAHHHRATLFRHQQYLLWPFPRRHWLWPWGPGRWPGSGWLVPVIRSGFATHRSPAYFLAPDDADRVEGVVGHIWASNKEIALTAGNPLQQGATAAAISEYAGKTFVSETWAARELSKKVFAASFRGVTVEGKAGRKWGVLILDSRDSQAALDAKLNIGPYAYCLGKFLERV